MTATVVQEGWELVEAADHDLDELMTWFSDERSVGIWGGPGFRYPFTVETFREDCRWGRMASYRLNSPDGEFSAFGQVYERYDRINLARLVAHPRMRGQGVGKRLVTLLMEVGPMLFQREEFSLFVFRNNSPAYKCYRSLGFVARDYPQGAPMADVCYYLTRPVQGSAR